MWHGSCGNQHDRIASTLPIGTSTDLNHLIHQLPILTHYLLSARTHADELPCLQAAAARAMLMQQSIFAEVRQQRSTLQRHAHAGAATSVMSHVLPVASVTCHTARCVEFQHGCVMLVQTVTGFRKACRCQFWDHDPVHVYPLYPQTSLCQPLHTVLHPTLIHKLVVC